MNLAERGDGKVRVRAWMATVLACLALPAIGRAQYVLVDEKNPDRYKAGWLAVPIAYPLGSDSAAAGAAGSESGLLQPQEGSFLFLTASSNGSYDAVAGMTDLQIRPMDRLFLDWQLSYFRTEHDENNIDGRPGYGHETAGSNNSSPRDFIGKASNDFIGDFTFKYLLPIGDGKDHVIDRYRLHNGLLLSGDSGGESFNPLASGRTYLEIEPFFEYLNIRSPNALRHQWDTNGLQLNGVYDNRDYLLTPERGNLLTLSLQQDCGIFGSSNPWTNLSAEFSQYISLGHSNLFRQQVLALDGWTSYCTSWSQSGPPGNLKLSNAPPFFNGAELGGEDKMRAFPEERFHDRAGVYGCAELRVIPAWNPLGEIKLLKPADIAWLQFVTFVEVGRVADEYTFEKLFSHMKGDVGAGIRVMTQDTVLRIDFAGSNEGLSFWAYLGQAF